MDSVRLCEYSGILGKPGVGFHTHYAGVAVFDLIGTVAIAAIISKATNWSFIIVFVVLMLIAVILHWLFCVPTVLNTTLGL